MTTAGPVIILYNFINVSRTVSVLFPSNPCDFNCLVVSQVSVAARDLVPVPSAPEYCGVERHSAVRVVGPRCAGVHHLSVTAGERFSQRHLPALLLQAGVQPQRLEMHGQCAKCIMENTHTQTEHI